MRLRYSVATYQYPKMKYEIVEKIWSVALMLILCLMDNASIAQTVDSTTIADFFSPQNVAAINDESKDSLFALIGDNRELKDLYWFGEAKVSLQTGKLDQAKMLAEEALASLDTSLPDYAKAKYYNVIASVYANQQDPTKAIEYFEMALSLSEEAEEEVNAALMRNNIANIYFSLVDYESAYRYVSEAYQTFQDYPDHPFYSNLVAVLSISEAKIGMMPEAKEHGQIALAKAEATGNIVGLIVANLALGEVANSAEQFSAAKNHFITSLEISERYQQTPFILLNSVGLLAANIGTEEYATAVKFGEKALELAGEGGNQTTEYSIKKNLAEAYFGTNQPRKAYQLMRESHEVFRDKNSIENKQAINDILLKYDTEKTEKELIVSRNALLQEQIEQNKLWTILGLLFLAIVALVAAMLFIRQRNNSRIALMKAEKAQEVLQAVFDGEELERERIARELHDGVASNLTAARYQLMANDNIPQNAKSQLEGILLQAHEDTRRLSHNLAPLYLEKYELEEALKQFTRENSTEKTKVWAAVIPAGKHIPKQQATVLYRVAQELTQNAIKHAEASEISIQILVTDDLTLVVEDNGKGFDVDSVKESNGLSGVARRAQQLGGSFEIDSALNQGTTTTFVLPLKV